MESLEKLKMQITMWRTWGSHTHKIDLKSITLRIYLR